MKTPVVARNVMGTLGLVLIAYVLIKSVPDLGRYVTVRPDFHLPTKSAPMVAPSSISVRRDKPLHMTKLPGGESVARAR